MTIKYDTTSEGYIENQKNEHERHCRIGLVTYKPSVFPTYVVLPTPPRQIETHWK